VGAVGASDQKDSTPQNGRRLLRCGISTRLMTAVGHPRPKQSKLYVPARPLRPESDIGHNVRSRRGVPEAVNWRAPPADSLPLRGRPHLPEDSRGNRVATGGPPEGRCVLWFSEQVAQGATSVLN
jgi:hypothetical protein